MSDPLTMVNRRAGFLAIGPRPAWQPLVVIALLALYYQLAHYVYWAMGWGWYYVLRPGPVQSLLKALEGGVGFRVSSWRFWSAITGGLLALALTYLAGRLMSRTRDDHRLVLIILGGGLVGIALLNMLGKVTRIAWIETLARDSLDFYLSPLTVIFLWPLLILHRASRHGRVGGQGV